MIIEHLVDKWYLSLWHQWINEYPDKERREGLLCIPEKYKENMDNIPDTLETQLKALKEIGFSNVDCYFKYGIFIVWREQVIACSGTMFCN